MISLKSSPSLGFPSCDFQFRPIQTNCQLRPIETIWDQLPTQTKLWDDQRVDGGDIGWGSGGRDRGGRGRWRCSYSSDLFLPFFRFREIFLTSSTCRHFRSGDQREADILEERARPLSWERWDRGDHKVGKQGNGRVLWLWRLVFISITKLAVVMYSASKLKRQSDILCFFSGQVLPPPLPLFRGGGRWAQDGDDRQEEHSSRKEDHHVLCDLLNSTSW